MFYIYKITNKLNGKVYIGKTNDPYQRMHSHLHYAKHGHRAPKSKYNYVHRAMNKYGVENFSFDIIDQHEDEMTVFALEQQYVIQFRSNERACGYNLTDGGEGSSGRNHTEETKEKIRSKALGRLHSEETKLAMSISRSGEGCGHNKLTKEQIPEILKLREEGFSYPAIGKIYGVTKTTIRKICAGKTWKSL